MLKNRVIALMHPMVAGTVCAGGAAVFAQLVKWLWEHPTVAARVAEIIGGPPPPVLVWLIGLVP